MHNLGNYFLEFQNPNETNEYFNFDSLSNFEQTEFLTKKKVNGIVYFCFYLVNQKGKINEYLTDDIGIYEVWVTSLKKVLNYKNMAAQYKLIKNIGKGKFSQVYLVHDLINNRDVAIKRIDKRNLKHTDLELIKTEVDILKICQHPYVIKLYDIIETFGTFNIVLEYCKGGNFFDYAKNREFNLTEAQIVSYIHKICEAVFTMHNLGIIHRDLKLSNIAMTDKDDNADIRILDFGLSKILGPGEKCRESYGTPGYAAPEVINETDYDYKADIWTIGVIAYFLCSGKLPFDYFTDGTKQKDYIKNTLNDEVKFSGDKWNKFSDEAKKFVKDLMVKDISKRMNITQVLEHEWIRSFYNDEVRKRKNSKKSKNSVNNNFSAFRLYAYNCLGKINGN